MQGLGSKIRGLALRVWALEVRVEVFGCRP